MIACSCSNIEESFIKSFLQNPHNNDEWLSFINQHNISKDCGTCVHHIQDLRNILLKKDVDN